MGNYLKLFETHTDYQAYIDGDDVLKPNVSYCEDNNDVHYNPIDPYGGHEYVEIGGLKWATMNLGANLVTDTGLYYQWGDTQGYTAEQVGRGEGQKYFGWGDYKWTNDGGSSMSKYNETDGKTVLDAEDDAVTAAWGSAWRMPTTLEWQLLGQNVDVTWTADYQGSGVKGTILTDKTDSSKVLFFPSTGNLYQGYLNMDSEGWYWSKSLAYDDYHSYGVRCIFGYNPNYSYNSNSRNYGFAIRPVAD